MSNVVDSGETVRCNISTITMIGTTDITVSLILASKFMSDRLPCPESSLGANKFVA
jgi:hypothetical protein